MGRVQVPVATPSCTGFRVLGVEGRFPRHAPRVSRAMHQILHKEPCFEVRSLGLVLGVSARAWGVVFGWVQDLAD